MSTRKTSVSIPYKRPMWYEVDRLYSRGPGDHKQEVSYEHKEDQRFNPVEKAYVVYLLSMDDGMHCSLGIINGVQLRITAAGRLPRRTLQS